MSTALQLRGLKEIPSELIEPYLKAMLSVELECIAFKPTQEQLDTSKANLKGVERFVSRFCGIHSRCMVTNVYTHFYEMTLEQAIEINKDAEKEIYE